MSSLHSTMYLLISDSKSSCALASFFTFHYVSININCWFCRGIFGAYFTFHYVSINMIKHSVPHEWAIDFTFHYVSINIVYWRQVTRVARWFFTFHYVSINISFSCFLLFLQLCFTFHYVSINIKRFLCFSCIFVLYIPLCIY